jgi:hypothetical protein
LRADSISLTRPRKRCGEGVTSAQKSAGGNGRGERNFELALIFLSPQVAHGIEAEDSESMQISL